MIEAEIAFQNLIGQENQRKTGDGFGGRFEAWAYDGERKALNRESVDTLMDIVVFSRMDSQEGPLKGIISKGDGTGGRV